MKEVRYKTVQFYDFIYMKFKSKLNSSTVVRGKISSQPEVGMQTGRGYREPCGVPEIFYILILVFITQKYTYMC